VSVSQHACYEPCTNFIKFSYVAYGASVLLWQHYNTLCTSDNTMFCCNGLYHSMKLSQQPHW